MKIVIHANQISWQRRYARYVAAGLRRCGLTDIQLVSTPGRVPCDIAIVMGPNQWQRVERANAPFVMINRKLLGEDANDVVAISWNGFNGRGKFCVDEVDPHRLERFINPDTDILDWKEEGSIYVLCEQSNLGRDTKFKNLEEYYRSVEQQARHMGLPPQHIIRRGKPKLEQDISFPKFVQETQNAKAVVSLNSTVSLDALMAGIPTITLDKGDPAYAITSHSIKDDLLYPNRLPYFQHLAHCQWHYSEIESGEFWKQIYPMQGSELSEWSSHGG